MEVLQLFDFTRFSAQCPGFLKTGGGYVIKWIEYDILCVATKLASRMEEAGNC